MDFDLVERRLTPSESCLTNLDGAANEEAERGLGNTRQPGQADDASTNHGFLLSKRARPVFSSPEIIDGTAKKRGWVRQEEYSPEESLLAVNTHLVRRLVESDEGRTIGKTKSWKHEMVWEDDENKCNPHLGWGLVGEEKKVELERISQKHLFASEWGRNLMGNRPRGSLGSCAEADRQLIRLSRIQSGRAGA